MNPALNGNVSIIRTTAKRYLVTGHDANSNFEVGPKELYLLELMDGEHSLDEIHRLFENQFDEKISPRRLTEFIDLLQLEGLLSTGIDDDAARTSATPDTYEHDLPVATTRPSGRSYRVNRVFDLLVNLFGWLISPVWTLIIVFIAVVAITGLVQNFSDFLLELLSLVQNLPVPIILIIAMVQLVYFDLSKAIAVGIACRKHGGVISRFGFRIHRGFIPTLACDIGNSLADMEPRAIWSVLSIRILTVIALTSLAGIFWIIADADTSLRSFFVIAELVGFIELFFFLNVFFPLDGYVLLSKALKVPRLFERSRAEIKAWLTLQPSPETLTRRQQFWFRFYALISILLIFIVKYSIIIFGAWWFTSRFEAPGAIAVIVLCYLWFRNSIKQFLHSINLPIKRFLRRFSLFHWHQEVMGGRNLSLPLRLTLFIFCIALGFLPYSFEVGGQCRLLAVAQHGVRAQLEDEIIAIHYQEGDWVEAGAVIAELSGRQINAAVKTVEAELAQASAELDKMLFGTRVEDLKIARRNVQRWQKEYNFLESQHLRMQEIARRQLASEEDPERTQTKLSTANENLQIAISEFKLLQDGTRKEDILFQLSKIDGVKARLESYRQNKALLKIRTPIAGRITTPYLLERLGQSTEVGDLIAVVQDTSQLIVEIAADQQAATVVQKGMRVKVRLNATNGTLLLGQVKGFAFTTEEEKSFGIDPLRTDSEIHVEQSLDFGDNNKLFRLNAELNDPSSYLIPGMTGYARVVVDDGILWSAIFRPILRFFNISVWSLLP